MKCPRCDFESLAGAQFCEKCGTSLKGQFKPYVSNARAGVGKSSASGTAGAPRSVDGPGSLYGGQSTPAIARAAKPVPSYGSESAASGGGVNASSQAPAPVYPTYPPAPKPDYPIPPGGQTCAYSPSKHGEVRPTKPQSDASSQVAAAVSAPAAATVTPAPTGAQDRVPANAYAAFEVVNGKKYYVANEAALIGRGGNEAKAARQLDVDLASEVGGSSVSRRHARLGRGQEIYLEDLGSANGTFVNEERLLPGVQRVIAEKDSVRFGAVKTIFHWRRKAER